MEAWCVDPQTDPSELVDLRMSSRGVVSPVNLPVYPTSSRWPYREDIGQRRRVSAISPVKSRSDRGDKPSTRRPSSGIPSDHRGLLVALDGPTPSRRASSRHSQTSRLDTMDTPKAEAVRLRPAVHAFSLPGDAVADVGATSASDGSC